MDDEYTLTAAGAPLPLDPDLQRFVKRLEEEARRLGSDQGLPLARRREIAELARKPVSTGGPAMACVRNVYLPCAAGMTRVRLFDPGGEGRRPTLVYLHGGGWMLFSLETHDRIMRELAVRSGMVVAGVDYGLSPEVRFPGALEQVAEIVSLFATLPHWPEIDPDRLWIGGDSAGGNLAIATALKLRDLGCPDLVRGCLLFYAVIDRICSVSAVRDFGGPDNILTAEEMETFWTNYLPGETDAQNPLANLSLATLNGLPPILSLIAERDVLAEQNIAFATALKRAGVEVNSRVFRGACHSFIEAAGEAAIAREALQYAADWLRSQSQA